MTEERAFKEEIRNLSKKNGISYTTAKSIMIALKQHYKEHQNFEKYYIHNGSKFYYSMPLNSFATIFEEIVKDASKVLEYDKNLFIDIFSTPVKPIISFSGDDIVKLLSKEAGPYFAKISNVVKTRKMFSYDNETVLKAYSYFAKYFSIDNRHLITNENNSFVTQAYKAIRKLENSEELMLLAFIIPPDNVIRDEDSARIISAIENVLAKKDNLVIIVNNSNRRSFYNFHNLSIAEGYEPKIQYFSSTSIKGSHNREKPISKSSILMGYNNEKTIGSFNTVTVLEPDLDTDTVIESLSKVNESSVDVIDFEKDFLTYIDERINESRVNRLDISHPIKKFVKLGFPLNRQNYDKLNEAKLFLFVLEVDEIEDGVPADYSILHNKLVHNEFGEITMYEA